MPKTAFARLYGCARLFANSIYEARHSPVGFGSRSTPSPLFLRAGQDA